MLARSASWWSGLTRRRFIALVAAGVVFIPLAAAPLSRVVRSLDAIAVQGFGITLLGALLWRGKWSLDKESVTACLRGGVNPPILLFVCWVLVSWCWSRNLVFSAQETSRILSGVVLYFVVAYQFRRREYLRTLMDALLFLGIAVSLYGFFLNYRAGYNYAAGPFGDHQLYGSFLIIMLPLAVAVAVTEQEKGRQLCAQCASVLLGASLLISQSRSAWIGGAIGIGCLTAMIFAASRRDLAHRLATHKHEFVMPVLLIVFAIGFFLMMSPQPSSILRRAASLRFVDKEYGWTYRKSLARAAVTMIRARPFTGFGVGQYPLEQRAYSHRGLPLRLLDMHPTISEQAHNQYLQTAVELGLPGLLLFLSILIVFFVTGIRRLRESESGARRALLAGSIAAVAAFTVDAYGSPSWQFGQVSLFFWLALGIGVACWLPRIKPSREMSSSSPAQNPAWTRAAAAIGFLLAASLITSVRASPIASIPRLHAAVLTAAPDRVRVGGTSILTLRIQFEDGSGRLTRFADVSDGDTENNPATFSMTYRMTGVGAAESSLLRTQGAARYPTNRVFSAPRRGLFTVQGVYSSPEDIPETGIGAVNILVQ